MCGVDWTTLSMYTKRKMKRELFECVGRNALNTFCTRYCLAYELHAVFFSRSIGFFLGRFIVRPKINAAFAASGLQFVFGRLK